jgi:hypothetical protein
VNVDTAISTIAQPGTTFTGVASISGLNSAFENTSIYFSKNLNITSIVYEALSNNSRAFTGIAEINESAEPPLTFITDINGWIGTSIKNETGTVDNISSSLGIVSSTSTVLGFINLNTLFTGQQTGNPSQGLVDSITSDLYLSSLNFISNEMSFIGGANRQSSQGLVESIISLENLGILSYDAYKLSFKDLTTSFIGGINKSSSQGLVDSITTDPYPPFLTFTPNILSFISSKSLFIGGANVQSSQGLVESIISLENLGILSYDSYKVTFSDLLSLFTGQSVGNANAGSAAYFEDVPKQPLLILNPTAGTYQGLVLTWS